MSIKTKVIVSFILYFMFCSWLTAADWYRWRGPEGNGIINEGQWSPASLTAATKPVWEANLGVGYSAPSIKGDLLYCMGNVKSKDIVYCLDVKTGKEKWRYSYDCGPGSYSGPRASPWIDGDLVYTFSLEGHLFCLDAKTGKMIWKQQVASGFGAGAPSWGFASSPVVVDEMLLLNVNKAGIAFNKKDGKPIWSTEKGNCGYSTPVIFTKNNVKYAAMFGEKAVYGVNISNGTIVWKYDWITEYDVNAADPLVFDNKVFITTNYNKGCALIDIKNDTPVLLWQNKNMTSHFSSLVYKDGYIYGCSGSPGGGNSFRCIDASTGKVKWEEPVTMGGFIVSNGYVLFVNERGKLIIFKFTPDGYSEAALQPVLKGTTWTAPVLNNDRIYLRNDAGNLVCIDLSAKK